MKKIKSWGALLNVSDLKKARFFYEHVLEQTVEMELEGENISFGSFHLQLDYPAIVNGHERYASNPTGAKIEAKQKSNSFQLAFEVEDVDGWFQRVRGVEGIEILHEITEYNWHQRVFRFYDHDKHIVEIGESMDAVALRFKAEGLTAEETALKIHHPIEWVKSVFSGASEV